MCFLWALVFGFHLCQQMNGSQNICFCPYRQMLTAGVNGLSCSLRHVCLTLNHLLSAFRMNVIITSKFLCLVTMRLCLRVEPTLWTPPAETTEWVHWFQLLVNQRHLMDRSFNAHPVVMMVCGQLSSLEQVGQELLGQARCPFESRQSNVGVFAGELLKHTHLHSHPIRCSAIQASKAFGFFQSSTVCDSRIFWPQK